MSSKLISISGSYPDNTISHDEDLITKSLSIFTALVTKTPSGPDVVLV